MALPSGVTTANLTFGSPASGFNGEGVSTSITVEPTISLTHIATGAPMLAFIISAEAAEGMPGQVTLPHTDQDGFQDANGNPFKNWAYKVTGTHKSGTKKAISFDKVIQLPQGQASPVDLDLIPRGNVIALPVQAEALRVTDVAGFTGSVTAEQLSTVVEGGGGTAPSDANIAPIIETAGDTRDAVDARAIAVGDTRYAPVFQPDTAYATGKVVLLPNGKIGTRTTGGTSRSSFDATEEALWTVAASGSTGSGLTPDPDNAGLYLIGSSSSLTPDPDHSGLYLIGA